jgi:hypothetical protein
VLRLVELAPRHEASFDRRQLSVLEQACPADGYTSEFACDIGRTANPRNRADAAQPRRPADLEPPLARLVSLNVGLG